MEILKPGGGDTIRGIVGPQALSSLVHGDRCVLLVSTNSPFHPPGGEAARDYSPEPVLCALYCKP